MTVVSVLPVVPDQRKALGDVRHGEVSSDGAVFDDPSAADEIRLKAIQWVSLVSVE